MPGGVSGADASIGVGIFLDEAGNLRVRREFSKIGDQAEHADRRVDRLKKRIASIQRVLTIAATAAVAFGTAIAGIAVHNLARAALEVQSLETAMTVATGSAAGARKELDFVRQTSDQLGISMVRSAQDFTKLSASARIMGFTADETRNIFLGVATASRAMRLSAEQTSGALTAIEQVMSKGRVQAEELRGQLGERIPGAFGLAAEAIGVTTAELDKMLETGQVTARDLLIPLADVLQNRFGPAAAEAAKLVDAEWQRFKDTLFELRAAAGQALLPVLASLSRQLAQIASSDEAANVLKRISDLLAVAGEAAVEGRVLEKIFTTGFAAVEQALKLAAAAGKFVVDNLQEIKVVIGAIIALKFQSVILSFVSAGQSLIASLKAINAGYGLLVKQNARLAATDAVRGLAGAFAGLLNPLNLVIAGIAALTIAYIKHEKATSRMTEVTDSFAESMRRLNEERREQKRLIGDGVQGEIDVITQQRELVLNEKLRLEAEAREIQKRIDRAQGLASAAGADPQSIRDASSAVRNQTALLEKNREEVERLGREHVQLILQQQGLTKVQEENARFSGVVADASGRLRDELDRTSSSLGKKTISAEEAEKALKALEERNRALSDAVAQLNDQETIEFLAVVEDLSAEQIRQWVNRVQTDVDRVVRDGITVAAKLELDDEFTDRLIGEALNALPIPAGPTPQSYLDVVDRAVGDLLSEWEDINKLARDHTLEIGDVERAYQILRSSGIDPTVEQVEYMIELLREAGELPSRMETAFSRVADALGSIANGLGGLESGIGRIIGTLASAADGLANIAGQYRQLKAAGGGGFLQGLAFGSSTASFVTGIGRDLGLFEGPQRTTQFGGKTAGDYSEELGQVGAVAGAIVASSIPVIGTALGSAVGGAIGAVVGGFISKGAEEALSSISLVEGALAGVIDKAEGGLGDAIESLTGGITDTINNLFGGVGAEIESLANIQTKIRGDEVIVFFENTRKVFESLEEATQWITLEVARTAQLSDGLDEALRQALQSGTAGSVEELQSNVATVSKLVEIQQQAVQGLSDFEIALNRSNIEIAQVTSELQAMGLSADQVTRLVGGLRVNFFQQWREQLTGETELSREQQLEQRKAQAQLFNAQKALYEAELRADLAKLEADKALLTGQLQIDQTLIRGKSDTLRAIAGVYQGELGLMKEFVQGGTSIINAGLQGMKGLLGGLSGALGGLPNTDLIDAQINAIKAILAALPSDIDLASISLPSVGGGAGGFSGGGGGSSSAAGQSNWQKFVMWASETLGFSKSDLLSMSKDELDQLKGRWRRETGVRRGRGRGGRSNFEAEKERLEDLLLSHELSQFELQLMRLVEQFDEAAKTAKKTGDEERLLAAKRKALVGLVREFFDPIRQLQEELLQSDLSPLSGAAKLELQRRKFEDLRAKALDLDEAALRDFPQASRDLLQTFATLFGTSSAQYRSLFEKVQNDLELILGNDPTAGLPEDVLAQIDATLSVKEAIDRVADILLGNAKAAGGPVMPGPAYLVGETGPELFLPDIPGTVLPADQVDRLMNAPAQVMAVPVSGGDGQTASEVNSLRRESASLGMQGISIEREIKRLLERNNELMERNNEMVQELSSNPSRRQGGIG